MTRDLSNVRLMLLVQIHSVANPLKASTIGGYFHVSNGFPV